MSTAGGELVRDRIPEIIRADGCIPVTRVLDEPEYRTALLAKLVEEAREAQSAPEPDLAGELADVLEVLSALAAAADLPWGQLVDLTAAKRDRRGGFEARISLEYVEQPHRRVPGGAALPAPAPGLDGPAGSRALRDSPGAH